MSKSKTVETSLFCSNCLEETNHIAQYRDDEIVKISCEKCGNEISLEHAYFVKCDDQDFTLRILSKPARMTNELKNDRVEFLRELPKRILTKPFRMYKEFKKKNKSKNA